MSTLGSRLRSAREKKGWSQTYVCQKLGISNSTLSGYERNYREPDVDMISTFAELYDVSTDYLLGRDEQKNDDLPPLLADLDPDLVKRFIEVMNNPLEDYFFHDILSASKEEREEIIREVVKIRKEQLKKK